MGQSSKDIQGILKDKTTTKEQKTEALADVIANEFLAQSFLKAMEWK